MRAPSVLSAKHAAVVPVPKLENDFYDWYVRHEAKVVEAAGGACDLVFIGDSITHLFEGHPNWSGRGERVWAEFYSRRKVLNLGFGWDRTQNVLWRLDHGEFTGQTPRLVVLLIGTNNLTPTANAPRSSPEQIGEGIAAICQRIRSLSPESRILLMGILPRSEPDDVLRGDIHRANELLKDYSQTQVAIDFVDIGDRFVDETGRIPVTLMEDLVHPTEMGYRIWAEALEPTVLAVLGGGR